MIPVLILISLIIINVIIFQLLKYKDEIWYEIYKKLGLIKDDE